MRLLPLLLRWVPASFVATLVALGVIVFSPVDRTLTIQIYVLVVGALALFTVLAITAVGSQARVSPFAEAVRARRRKPPRPEELERLERQVALAVENAFDFHFRLRPSLVAAADAALWRAHGVPLERGQDRVPADLWDLVRPDREPPQDRLAPGTPLDRLNAAVDALEGMSR